LLVHNDDIDLGEVDLNDLQWSTRDILSGGWVRRMEQLSVTTTPRSRMRINLQ
jgi:hypothetical protein